MLAAMSSAICTGVLIPVVDVMFGLSQPIASFVEVNQLLNVISVWLIHSPTAIVLASVVAFGVKPMSNGSGVLYPGTEGACTSPNETVGSFIGGNGVEDGSGVISLGRLGVAVGRGVMVPPMDVGHGVDVGTAVPVGSSVGVTVGVQSPVGVAVGVFVGPGVFVGSVVGVGVGGIGIAGASHCSGIDPVASAIPTADR